MKPNLSGLFGKILNKEKEVEKEPGVINNEGQEQTQEKRDVLIDAIKQSVVPVRTFYSFDLRQTGTYLWELDVYEIKDGSTAQKIHTTVPNSAEVAFGKIISFYEEKDHFWKERLGL